MPWAQVTRVDHLTDSDEVFISNSLIRVMPVRTVDGEECGREFEATVHLQGKLS